MNDTNAQKRIEENVLARLKAGKVRMHSSAYFIARTALVAALSLLVLALSAYVLSFIAFALHESGEQFLLGFGARGIATFILLFPWLQTIADVILIVFLEWLLQRFRFGYRISLLVLFLGIALLSTLLAAAIGFTPLQGQLLGMADRGELPLIGPAYEDIRDPHESQGVFRGTVVSIGTDDVVITHDDGDDDHDDGIWQLELPAGYATSSLSIGEQVFVFGTSAGPVLEAQGMQQLPPDPDEAGVK